MSHKQVWPQSSYSAEFCHWFLNLGVATLVVAQTLAAQTPPKPKVIPPSVSVLLPPDVPSETVQIAYYLSGPFGGYERYTDEQAGAHSYEIATSEPAEVSLITHPYGHGPASRITRSSFTRLIARFKRSIFI